MLAVLLGHPDLRERTGLDADAGRRADASWQIELGPSGALAVRLHVPDLAAVAAFAL